MAAEGEEGVLVWGEEVILAEEIGVEEEEDSQGVEEGEHLQVALWVLSIWIWMTVE